MTKNARRDKEIDRALRTHTSFHKHDGRARLRGTNELQQDSPAENSDDNGKADTDVLPHGGCVIPFALQLVHPAGQKQILPEL